MLRSTLLYLSNQPQVFKFVRNNRLAKGFARRFVAGETLDDALAVVRALNAQRISASLDELGESVTNERDARATRDSYLHILDRPAADDAEQADGAAGQRDVLRGNALQPMPARERRDVCIR